MVSRWCNSKPLHPNCWYFTFLEITFQEDWFDTTADEKDDKALQKQHKNTCPAFLISFPYVVNSIFQLFNIPSHQSEAWGQVERTALWQMISSTLSPHKSIFLSSGWNDCWMGLQNESIFCFFCDRSFKIINKMFSGENNYSRDSVAIHCVNF